MEITESIEERIKELRKEGIREWYRAIKITKSITWDFKALIFIGFVKSRVSAI